MEISLKVIFFTAAFVYVAPILIEYAPSTIRVLGNLSSAIRNDVLDAASEFYEFATRLNHQLNHRRQSRGEF